MVRPLQPSGGAVQPEPYAVTVNSAVPNACRGCNCALNAPYPTGYVPVIAILQRKLAAFSPNTWPLRKIILTLS